MINTAIFDMDGLLLDTEPIWGRCMTAVAKLHGLSITPTIFKSTTGLRIIEVCEHWERHYPWQSGASATALANEIVQEVVECSRKETRVLEGVLPLLQLLKEKDFKIGLASSSTLPMILALVEHFDLQTYFDSITSADEVDYGKPHPAVFLKCAVQLKSFPYECVVFEDSVNGVIAGKAARMKVVAVPDEANFDDPRFAIADLRLNSLDDFTLRNLDGL